MSDSIEDAALQMIRHYGLDREQLRAQVKEEEARAQAEHEAGYLGDGQPPPADAYVLGQVEAALVKPEPTQAALALLRDPAFLGESRKASRATVDVLCKKLRPLGIGRAAVDEAIGKTASPRTSKPIGRPDPEPAPQPQDTGELLGELRQAVAAHVVVPGGADLAISLWAMHTWALDAARYTPRLAITSPTKRCGKSTVLELLDLLCARSLRTASISPAALYRAVEAARPTLLVDEADSFLVEREELRGVLNAGYERGGHVLRCVGDDHEPQQFACYAAVAIATIGELPGTIADRSITIRMTRKSPGTRTDRLGQAARDRLEAFRPRLARWAADAVPRLKDADPPMPERLNDRQRDICGPLVAIADLAGALWATKARAALVALCAASEEDAADVHERALAAVWAQYSKGVDFKALGELVETMKDDESAGWATAVRGRPLDTGTLARWLKTFGAETRQRRVGGDRPRGYDRADLAPIAELYLATTAPPARDTVPNRDKRRDGVTASATSDSPSGNGVTPPGTPPPRHAVTPDSGGGSEVAWRATAMRLQVPAVGALPYFVAKPGSGGAGRCPSCGDPSDAGKRCGLCNEAVRLVIAEAEARRARQ